MLQPERIVDGVRIALVALGGVVLLVCLVLIIVFIVRKKKVSRGDGFPVKKKGERSVTRRITS